MKLIGYTLGQTKTEQEAQKAELQERFPEIAKVYSESCGRNGFGSKPTRQTRGHALMAVQAGDVLVTDKLERLAADGAELAAICCSLLAEGVHILATEDDIDTRKDSMFQDFMKAQLGKMRISKVKAAEVLADARKRGSRTRKIALKPEAAAMLAKAKEEGATFEQRRKLHQQLLSQQEAEIVDLLKQGKAPLEVSKIVGVGHKTVRSIAKAHDVKIDKRFKDGIKGRILGAEDQQAIAKRIVNGEKASALAKEYGVKITSIYRAQQVMDGRVKLKRYQNGATGKADSSRPT